jgi:hypothetical protein
MFDRLSVSGVRGDCLCPEGRATTATMADIFSSFVVTTRARVPISETLG